MPGARDKFQECSTRRELAELAFRRCAPMVLSIARRVTGDRSDAEDVLQDVFVALMRHNRALEDPRCVPGFLRTAAIRTSWRLIRRRRRADRHGDPLSTEPTPSIEDGAIVRDMLSKLAPQEKLAVALRCVSCHSNESVAQRLGVSVSTARRRVANGLLALRSMQEMAFVSGA